MYRKNKTYIGVVSKNRKDFDDWLRKYRLPNINYMFIIRSHDPYGYVFDNIWFTQQALYMNDVNDLIENIGMREPRDLINEIKILKRIDKI